MAAQQKRKEEALHHEARLPQYKRNLRRKLLKLRHLFRHQQKQVRASSVGSVVPCWHVQGSPRLSRRLGASVAEHF